MLAAKLTFFNHKSNVRPPISLQPTDEIKQYSIDRTKNHIEKVKNNMEIMEGYKDLTLQELRVR